MSASSLSCINLQSYFCNPCGDKEKGGIWGVVFTNIDAPMLDPSNNQYWVDLIEAGYAIVIPNVKGTYDGGAVTEAGGFGGQVSMLDQRNHTLNYMHLFSCENLDFYNILSKQNNLEAWFMTGTRIFKSGAPVMVYATMPIEESFSSTMLFNVTVKWSNEDMPQCFDRPGALANCAAIERARGCITPNPVDLYPC